MLSIIIPSYNKPELLKKCIKSIKDTKNSDFEVIIVDNGSTEPLFFDEENVRYIKLKFNHGFSKAVNIGIKQAKGNLIAILNNDTEVDTFWIENIINTFEKNSDIIYATSKIKSLKNKELIDDVGDVILSYGRVYKIGNKEKDMGQYDEQCFIFGASGCASVYRREFFDKVGYFDEDFFAYLEDVDLSFRANLLGYQCLYVPSAVVYHVGSATTGSQYNNFTIFHLAQNTLNVIVKNYPLGILLQSLLPVLGYIFALQIFFLLKGNGISFFKGLISGLSMVPKMKCKRNQIVKRRILSSTDLKRTLIHNKQLYKYSKKNLKM
ncbi:MAG: putative glycosyltransferase [Clostridiaceae bacterium]|jgi:GT2 family glycosyltransferase|nr:putative glycosyltransferase [Clostridiaceae bacterium]